MGRGEARSSTYSSLSSCLAAPFDRLCAMWWSEVVLSHEKFWPSFFAVGVVTSRVISITNPPQHTIPLTLAHRTAEVPLKEKKTLILTSTTTQHLEL